MFLFIKQIAWCSFFLGGGGGETHKIWYESKGSSSSYHGYTRHLRLRNQILKLPPYLSYTRGLRSKHQIMHQEMT